MSLSVVTRLITSAGFAVAGLSMATVANAQNLIYQQAAVVYAEPAPTHVSVRAHETYKSSGPDGSRVLTIDYREDSRRTSASPVVASGVGDLYAFSNAFPTGGFTAPFEKLTYLSYAHPAVTVYTTPQTLIATNGFETFAVGSDSIARVAPGFDGVVIPAHLALAGAPDASLDPFSQTLRRH